MNDDVSSLIRELDESREAIRRDKEVLKEEANPVKRIRRSWASHKAVWIGAGAAVVGLAALLVFSRRKAGPVVPKGYVVVRPEPPPKPWVSALKFAVMMAKPVMAAAGAWAAKKAGRNGNGAAAFRR